MLVYQRVHGGLSFHGFRCWPRFSEQHAKNDVNHEVFFQNSDKIFIFTWVMCPDRTQYHCVTYLLRCGLLRIKHGAFRHAATGWELLHQSLYQFHLYAGRKRQDLLQFGLFWTTELEFPRANHPWQSSASMQVVKLKIVFFCPKPFCWDDEIFLFKIYESKIRFGWTKWSA